MPEETRTTGPLRPIELATASVLAGVAVALTVIGWFLPHLGPVAALAVVPLGVVAHRHRFRALAASAFAASILSFLVAGTGTVSNIVECAVVGGFVGTAMRRNWGFGIVAAAMAVIAPVLAAISVGLLYVFGSIRKLTLDQIRNTWKGMERLLRGFTSLHPAVHRVDGFVTAAIRDWWITVGVIVIAATFWFAALAWVLLGPVLERLKWLRAVDRLDVPDKAASGPAGVPYPARPVPVSLEHVSFRYPQAETDALDDITLQIDPRTFVALVGDNGSGKSTLARLIAGRPPTSGSVHRGGDAALGRPGGTAMVMQHPETQILGVRVADDVVWGLRDAAGVDVEALLGSVGLDGMGERETSTLSGGELQRLAVAAALARSPRLLISDESTAMVDAPGRQKLMELLSGLPAAAGVTVVHVTHRHEETVGADHKYRLSEGRVMLGDEEPSTNGDARDTATSHDAGRAPADPASRLELRGLGHTYGAGSPWAHKALEGIDLEIAPGEGVLVVGTNGSGKSTLAWIMAGVLNPSRGSCTLGGQPVRSRAGTVGLAFQHARLQLQRSTVKLDLLAAGAEDEDEAAAHLAAVGLDWSELAERKIDELSGGQQRRVALAGVLARRPSVLVLDEPLAGLDRLSQESLVTLLSRLRHEHGMTVVVISHDLEGMERVCDRVVRLEDGRVTFDGPRAEAPC